MLPSPLLRKESALWHICESSRYQAMLRALGSFTSMCAWGTSKEQQLPSTVQSLLSMSNMFLENMEQNEVTVNGNTILFSSSGANSQSFLQSMSQSFRINRKVTSKMCRKIFFSKISNLFDHVVWNKHLQYVVQPSGLEGSGLTRSRTRVFSEKRCQDICSTDMAADGRTARFVLYVGFVVQLTAVVFHL